MLQTIAREARAGGLQCPRLRVLAQPAWRPGARPGTGRQQAPGGVQDSATACRGTRSLPSELWEGGDRGPCRHSEHYRQVTRASSEPQTGTGRGTETMLAGCGLSRRASPKRGAEQSGRGAGTWTHSSICSSISSTNVCGASWTPHTAEELRSLRQIKPDNLRVQWGGRARPATGQPRRGLRPGAGTPVCEQSGAGR